MGKITELKHKLQKKAGQVIVEEAIKRLEAAIELKDQGKEAEGDKVVNDMKAWLDGLIEEFEKKQGPEEQPIIGRSSLPQFGEVIAEGDKVILGVIKVEEKEKYLSVNSEYSCMKKAFEDKKFREETWKDFVSDNSFVCSIYDKKSRDYVGYCSVKSLVKDDWELAIELLPDACHKGYGTESLSLLMQALHELTGRRYYRARVEIDNHASQGLMKKLGAIPNGISEFLLHGEEIEKFQEEYKDMITDEIRAVAAEFCMDAEDILGYVLEYRFDVEKE
ncbi:MAG: GNAT family N-acetyltransferase [Lachnospiraceae bacterium]|nr:GNAT family N-acetyltransferase [Lachnospiraceae bacterium]MBQ3583401.1 GNAT family N-acetyltransferase [Lachnospiraceae bacterium]